jgi:hypothetical protein
MDIRDLPRISSQKNIPEDENAFRENFRAPLIIGNAHNALCVSEVVLNSFKPWP